MKPSIGRIVIVYNAPGRPDQMPAIVCAVHEENKVECTAFNYYGASHYPELPHKSEVQGAETCWDWPERVS